MEVIYEGKMLSTFSFLSHGSDRYGVPVSWAAQHTIMS